jgi:hypothetical protein
MNKLLHFLIISTDFHPTCVGYVTHRFPSHCVVNGDVYVPNKLLDHLPAPVRIGRTQLRLAVKSVTQGIPFRNSDGLRQRVLSHIPSPISRACLELVYFSYFDRLSLRMYFQYRFAPNYGPNYGVVCVPSCTTFL